VNNFVLIWNIIPFSSQMLALAHTYTHIHTHTLRTKLVKLIKLISMGDRIKNVFTSTINKLRAS
jgi:hypothetical protein